ncbi:hypothetical protein Esi_0238_0041 [Ectocarpus siliculosus]|uniref:ferredoxin--NADP(+) reductase n=1 Tax=Ectocarpus siliculosus TaxID=2880 RepID=D7FSR5_ECTSI|nr:hypothetical protein Esi_0238_0041 [Ectocarpus siliculosus]|eukprot:CBJ31206.1 hypothetical protein Esi_0238_0041 [Ectocarpus siliculosus]
MSAGGGSEGATATLERVKSLSDKVSKLQEVLAGVQASRGLPSSTAAAPAPAPAAASASATAAAAAAGGSAKPKRKANALVWAGAPSEEFIAGADTRSLEREPYWDMSELPMHTFKAKAPYTGTIETVEKLVQPGASGEVFHVKLRHEGNMPYWEGQSLGVTPPGLDAKGKPHKVRLYSIASTRYGDDGDGRTVSLCVRRATVIDPETGKEDPSKEGVCSNFLCRARAGQEVTLTGPSGKIMLLPEETPDADVIMVGTGTGIAPYRGFLQRLFKEDTPAARAFTGTAWLFLGVATTEGLLYHDDWMEMLRKFPFNFRCEGREEKNASGGKMYIQDRVEQYADEVFERLDGGAHIYFCGLKGMMPGITDMLARVAGERGISWDAKLKELKSKGQWHVEVY